ncbi:MAG: Gfo/Idh/MocA family oxidoreductase [Pseudomonadota bacterium]
MSDKVRWGIIGAGNIAHRFASDMQHSETGLLAGIASRTESRAKEFAEQYPGCATAADYGTLVSRADIDAIYIATPNSLHCEHALLAIAAGKPVLIEKPFALSADEATQIFDAAAAKNVFCMEAMWTRFLPTFTAIRERVKEGQLGTVSQFQANLGFPRLEKEGDPITDPALGGGALRDLGVYGLSLARDLMGPATIVASNVTVSKGGSIRDVAIILRHEGNNGLALSTVSASHSTVLPNVLGLYGTKGTIQTEAPFLQASQAWSNPVAVTEHKADGSQGGALSILKNSAMWPTVKKVGKAILGKGGSAFGTGFPGTGLQFQIDGVGHCLRAGECQSPIMPHDQSVAIAAQIDQILGAAR